MKLSEEFISFHGFANSFKTYVAANASHLNASTAEVNKLTTLLGDWNPKFLKYIDPATHNEAAVKDVQNAYKIFHPFIERVKSSIKSDEMIELSGADQAGLGLKLRAPKRVHVGRPEISLLVDVLSWIATQRFG